MKATLQSLARIAMMLSFCCSVPSQAGGLPEDASRSLFEEKCTSCHVASKVTAQGRTEAQWAQVVETMVLNGAQLSDAEFFAIVDYLSENFGPASEDASTGDSS